MRMIILFAGASGNGEKHIYYKKFAFGNEVIKNGKVFWD